MSAPASKPGTIERGFINVINFGGHLQDNYYGLGMPVVSGSLGTLGAQFAHAGWRTGLLQGATTGLTHVWLVRPIKNWVVPRTGTGQNQITPAGINFLRLVGFISELILPIFAVKLAQRLNPQFFGTGYTFKTGLIINFTPAALQTIIEIFRKVESQLRK